MLKDVPLNATQFMTALLDETSVGYNNNSGYTYMSFRLMWYYITSHLNRFGNTVDIHCNRHTNNCAKNTLTEDLLVTDALD